MENRKAAIPFSVSTIFFILYLAVEWIISSLNLGDGKIVYLENLLKLPVETYLLWFTILTLVVFVFIKKLQLVPTICVGVLSLFAVQNAISAFRSYEFYGTGELWVIVTVFRVIAFMLLVMVAIGSVTKRGFKGIGYVWFVPMILWLLSMFIDFIDIVEEFGEPSGKLLAFFALVLLADIFYTVAFCLLCKWFGAVICNQREALSAPVFTRRVAEVSAEPAAPAVQVAPTVSEQLKKYQDLLMAGVITDEEYEAKRKQILGL